MKLFLLKTTLPIAALLSFRMLGLFMLIPVFTIYAPSLQAATPRLIGIALGCYGLSQGLLQIPFGMLSDHFGRKPIITIGLMLFIMGSFLGTITHSIYGMIIARTIQGTGAIGSVLIALLADLTPDEQRTKAMAIIGITIGASVSAAMIISPTLTNYFDGLSGIFYLTTGLGILGLVILHTIIPTPKKNPSFHIKNTAHAFKITLTNHQLQRLNIGIFCQHLILTSTFFAIPIVLKQHMQHGQLTHAWHFYLPLMFFSFIFMLPMIHWAEKKQQQKPVFLLAIIVTSVCQLLLSFTTDHWITLCTALFLYFIVFNFLESSLPSLISRQAPIQQKGTAMGIYSSSQFLGIFAGGTLGGLVYSLAGPQGIFVTNSLVAFAWVMLAKSMQPNIYQFTHKIPVANNQLQY